MTRDPEPEDPKWIDELLQDVSRAPVPNASDALMARVLSDAEALLPPPGGLAVPVDVPLWRQFVGGLGGWRAMGGLAVAGVAGLAIGLGAFDAVGLDALWSAAITDEFDSQAGLSAFGWDYEEG